MLREYYRKRALEYEDIYRRKDPDRQKELKKVQSMVREYMRGRHIIEAACGTGFWTQNLSDTANRIVATDILPEMIAIARVKKYNCPVYFCYGDAHQFPLNTDSFDGGLASFWISHVSRGRLNTFLLEFHRILKPGSRVTMLDNNYIPDVGGELIRKDNNPNTYKERFLQDGSRYEVLKNYYSEEELAGIFGKYAGSFDNRNMNFGKYYWRVNYLTKNKSPAE
jgi:SAM-dependent methyltransferase